MGWNRKVPVDINDPRTWLLRGEVAKLLRCSVFKVRSYEGTKLHPFVDERGAHRYNPTEVAAIEVADKRKPRHHAPTQGELEAAAIALIRDGKSKLDIVQQLALPMHEVQRIWDEAQLSFEEAAEEKRKAEVRERHEARMRELAERKSRERIAQLRVERAHELADTAAAKQLQKLIRSLGVKPPHTRKDPDGPQEEEAERSEKTAGGGADDDDIDDADR